MSFSVTILGSNSALPTSDRYPTAQVLRVSERFFLIDCGEGTQMQLRKCKIAFAKINHIFISHLHGDHCFGLIGLISTFGLLGRKNDLMIFSPPGLEALLRPHLDFFCADLPYNVQFVALNTSANVVVYEDKKVIVESFPLAHRIPTCGFVFREKQSQPNIRKEAIFKYDLSIREIAAVKERVPFIDEDGNEVPQSEMLIEPPIPRSYAFCSDTKYSRKILPFIQGVDLLYHEATFLDALKTLAKSTGHSTAKQAATIAKDAQVGKLLIGHFSSRYRNLSVLLDEAKTVFTNSHLAREQDVFEIHR